MSMGFDVKVYANSRKAIQKHVKLRNIRHVVRQKEIIHEKKGISDTKGVYIFFNICGKKR